MGLRRSLIVVLALPAGLLVGQAHASLPTLQQAFDNVGITVASDAAAGNFDEIGDSFSATGLAADALTPGQPLLHDGLAITWPDVEPGQPDNVIADGQRSTGSAPTTG